METKSIKPICYIFHAFIVFGLLGSEFLVFLLSRIVDGRDISQLFSWPVNWYAAIFHWMFTIAIWGAGALFYTLWARKKGVFSDLINFKLNSNAALLLIAGTVLVVIYALLGSRLTGHAIPQVYNEFLGFRKMYGSYAFVVSFFQNLYYLFEFVLVVIIIVFFQKAGELWFKANNVPWGGLGLMLTWGSIHFITNPQGALGIMIWSLVFGMIYVLGKKNFYPVYLVALLGFII